MIGIKSKDLSHKTVICIYACTFVSKSMCACTRALCVCVCACVKYNIQTIQVISICKVLKVNISGFPVPLHLFKTSSCQSSKWIMQIRTCLISLQPTRFELYKVYQYAKALRSMFLVFQCLYCLQSFY